MENPTVHIIVDGNNRLIGVFKTPDIDSTIHKISTEHGKFHVLETVNGMKEQQVIDNYLDFAHRILAA